MSINLPRSNQHSSSISSLLHSHGTLNLKWCDKIKLSYQTDPVTTLDLGRANRKSQVPLKPGIFWWLGSDLKPRLVKLTFG